MGIDGQQRRSRTFYLQPESDELHLFQDKASSARDDRSGLVAALEFVRPGDCLLVWKLDRLIEESLWRVTGGNT
jgi:DNA invertase Pin-like site-specific DNA recombinase